MAILRMLRLCITMIVMHLMIVIYKWLTDALNNNTKTKIEKIEKRPILAKELYKQASISFVTIILWVVNLLIWIMIHLLYYYNYKYLSYKICLIIWVINLYIAWTPMHEAVHNTIASKQSGYTFLNGLIGRICALMLVSPYPLWRYVHLKHHKYTNIASHDPDYFSLSAPYRIILPFKWHLQIYKYLCVYLENITKQPITDIIEFFIYVIVSDYICNIFENSFFIFILPSWIATTILAFVFNYIPHRNEHNQSLNQFNGTNVTSLYNNNSNNISILTIPFMYQNYHIIHHLYPSIPFYNYSKIWYKINHLLLKKGTTVKTLLPIF